jgi:hypothetical protein
MATEKRLIDVTEPIAHEKIKAFDPQIVVSDSPSKPYYSISYYDIAKKEWYIGYSSYDLKNVYKWLFECFEEVECDMVEVVRCKDCRFRKSTFNGDGYFCSVWDTDDYEEAYVKDNDFCSYGERKDND